MSKVLAVLGATGLQGNSVINFVLSDPVISKEYSIRALTRDPSSPAATKLASREGVSVVKADALDRASLSLALSGVHTLFEMTNPTLDTNAEEIEYQTAKCIADIAVEQGVQYIIFSTLPSVTAISGGKYKAIAPFDAKARAEAYIRGLPIQKAFFSGGSFMQNLVWQDFLAPRLLSGGENGEEQTYAIPRSHTEALRFPMLDAAGDTGKFVGAILAEPDMFEGKTICGATRVYGFDEIMDVMSKASGKNIVLKLVSDAEFGETMPAMKEVFTDYFHSVEENGYWGPETEEVTRWGAENARGGPAALTTLEEFFKVNKPMLMKGSGPRDDTLEDRFA